MESEIKGTQVRVATWAVFYFLIYREETIQGGSFRGAGLSLREVREAHFPLGAPLGVPMFLRKFAPCPGLSRVPYTRRC